MGDSMSVFYYHRQNSLAKKLSEMANIHGFMYTNRSEMELRIQRQIAEAGYDIWSTFHCIIGSLAGSIDLHIPLNPDDELDRHTLKLCKTKSPWCFLKVINGPTMSGVVGYCSSGAESPFLKSNIQMAQEGIIRTSYVPRPV